MQDYHGESGIQQAEYSLHQGKKKLSLGAESFHEDGQTEMSCKANSRISQFCEHA